MKAFLHTYDIFPFPSFFVEINSTCPFLSDYVTDYPPPLLHQIPFIRILAGILRTGNHVLNITHTVFHYYICLQFPDILRMKTPMYSKRKYLCFTENNDGVSVFVLRCPGFEDQMRMLSRLGLLLIYLLH